MLNFEDLITQDSQKLKNLFSLLYLIVGILSCSTLADLYSAEWSL